MKRMWSTMAVAAGLLAATGCANDVSGPEGEDSVSGQAAYLFGLSEAELLSIYPLASEQHADAASWLAFNRAPFECARYGDLCRLVGAPAAEDITREALHLALAGAELDTIVAELDRATEQARIVLSSQPENGLARDSQTGTAVFPCGNHRLRTETSKVNPVFGSRYGRVNCKLQEDLGSGIWGGTPDADELVAFVEIVGTGEDASASQDFVHSLTSPKVYPGANQTVRGECTGDHNGNIEERAVSVN